MAAILVNEYGEFYGGFDSETAQPAWLKSKRKEVYLDEAIADLALKQLTDLGFQKITKEHAEPPKK